MARTFLRSMSVTASRAAMRSFTSSPWATPFSPPEVSDKCEWASIAGKRDRATRVSRAWSALRGSKSLRARDPPEAETFSGSLGEAAIARPVAAAPSIPAPNDPNHSRRLAIVPPPSHRGAPFRLTPEPRHDPVDPAAQRNRVVELPQPHAPPEHDARRPALHVRLDLLEDAPVVVVLHPSREEHEHVARGADDAPQARGRRLLQGES